MKQINGIIMQYFEWYMNCNQNLWNEIADKAEKLADIGITALWLPPAFKGIGGKDEVGYGVYDVYDLGEENLKYGMYLFIDIFFDKIKENREEKKAIYLDEIWRLIGVTSNKEVAGFIYKIFKTIRKYGGSSVAITQDISDIFSLENGTYGKSILNNSSIKTFFALEEDNIKVLENFTNLSEKEKIEIKSLKRGENLMFVGDEHILVKIECSELEKEIIEGENKNEKNYNSN